MTTVRSSGRVLPFRRRRFAVRHRRRGLLLPLLRAFVAAAVLVALPFAAGVWLATTPRLDLRRVEVEGTEHVPAAWVRQALRPLAGRNLLLMSMPAVEKRLSDHPWLRGVEIHKRLPDHLEVRLLERRPVALLRCPDGLYFADESGRAIVGFTPGSANSDLPLVSCGSGGQAVRTALEVATRLTRARPDWGEGLSEIEVLGDAGFRLHTAALPFPLLVDAGRLEAGIAALEEHLGVIEERFPELAAVDLRFARQIVVQPAVPGPPS